jgi:hypothetical protein
MGEGEDEGGKLWMTNEKHPPRRKRHPSKEGNCSIYSPIEGGFKGGVHFSFFVYSFFTNIGIFRIEQKASNS